MNKIKFIGLTFIFLLVAYQLIAQVTVYTIKGVVLEDKTLKPLAGVTIADSITGKGVISNDTGEFIFRFERYPVFLQLKHLGYKPEFLSIQNHDQYNNIFRDQLIPFVLFKDQLQIEEVVIGSNDLAIQLLVEVPFSIVDFIIHKGFIIAQTFRNNNPLNKELLLTDLEGNHFFSTPMSSLKEFFTDCYGNLYAVTKNEVYHIDICNDSLYLKPKCDLESFEANIKPILVNKKNYRITQFKSKNGQYHDYYINRFDDLTRHLLYRVGQVSNEYFAGSINRQLKAQHTSKINRGFINPKQLRIINNKISNLNFDIQTNYRPVSSALFDLGDSILIFDFFKQMVICHGNNGELLWDKQIKIDLSNNWTGRVHYDLINNRFFLEFNHIQATYLVEIDPHSGESIGRIHIDKYKHIDHIQIHNNRLFFLHQKDIGNRGKRILYKYYN
ncbi:MAG: carboxypeptidase-like regulatory domain-containing protein [Bacteroidota bacterium]|nr:carboxypeptidase-like regulatory domain-containing protein [Bacteroidota bacterium]